MEVLTLSILAAASVGTACYLTGWWSAAVSFVADLTETSGRWLVSPDGARSDLARELPLRDIYPDMIETTSGWFWVAAEIKPVPTDGYSPEDWASARTTLNWVVTSVSPGTRVQTLTRLSGDVSEYVAVHRRNAEGATDDGARLLEEERARTLERDAAAGRVRTTHQTVLIGRRVAALSMAKGQGARGFLRFAAAKLKGLFGLGYHVEMSREEVTRVYEDLCRERARFCDDFRRAGGHAAPTHTHAVWKRYYERLNPEVTGSSLEPPAYSHHTNPRRLLCQTDVAVGESGALRIGDQWAQSLSLHGLPSKTYAGLMEAFTRAVTFDCELSTWFEAHDEMLQDEELKDRQEFLAALIERNQADTDERAEYDELVATREMTRAGVERVATVGFAVYFEAESEGELRRRRGAIRSLLQQCWGLECSADSLPVEQWAATLPGGCELDRRGAPVRSTNAAALQCWTGAPSGVPAAEALMVFRLASGGLFGWHPDSRRVSNAGIELAVGESGSGKSSYFNLCRAVAAGLGVRQCSFDFNGSATRVCLAAGGTIIRLAERQPGVFPPWPLDEEFADADLTSFGMPRDWLKTLTAMLAQLATDDGAGETKLPKHLRAIIHKAVMTVYEAERASRQTPALDELRFALDHWPDHAEANEARMISNRLREYAGERFLSDRTSHELSTRSPYVVFDFAGLLDDPVSAELGAMSAATFVERFAATDRRIKKRFDGDELDTICGRIPRVASVFNLTGRNMRKQGGMVAAASQSPLDFERTELRGLRVSSSIRWFFRLSSAEEAARVFNLSPGVTELIATLGVGDETYRPCVLQTPQGVAKLHLAHGPLDRRLLLGAAATEHTSMDEVMDHIEAGGRVPASLLAALEADALGAPQPTAR